MPLRRKPRTAFRKKTYTRRTTATRRRAPRKRRTPNNGRMIMYRAPYNSVMPREFLTKLRSRYSGTILPAGFAAGQAVNIPLHGNDCFTPFSGFTAIGAGITWMNATSPAALSATGFATFAKVDLYESCLVLGTKIKVCFNPSIAGDEVIASITPTNTAAGGNPVNVTQALKQPFTRFMEFRSAGAKPSWLKCYVKWSRFLGLSSKAYTNDPSSTWAHLYNAAPASLLWLVLNINTLDCVVPVAAAGIPFTIEMVHYVRFYKFDAAQVNP